MKNLSIENKQRSKIKKWLVLLLRALALACIIVAFSQPVGTEEINQLSNPAGKENICIYIDNSFSMNVASMAIGAENGSALGVAKNKAFDLINSLPDISEIRVYSNDISHEPLGLNKKKAIAKVQEIQPSPVLVKLSEQIKKINFDSNENFSRLFVFSDFQKNQSDFENIQISNNMTVTLLPLPIQQADNLLLDSCWFEKPYQRIKESQELSVRVRNISNQDYHRIPVQLYINDSIKSVSNITVAAQSNQVVKLRYVNHQPGICKGKVEINDFPISYDNELYFSYAIHEKDRILSINQTKPNHYLNKLFSSSDQFDFKNIEKPQFFNENPDNYQLIILNELKDIENGLGQIFTTYLANGGHLLLIPGDSFQNSVNSFLQNISAPQYLTIDTSARRLSNIELNSEIYQNVFEQIQENARLPDVFQFYKLAQPESKLSENILKTTGGENLLTKQNYGKGQFFQFSMNLLPNWTNLVTHPIFVPTIVNLASRKNINNSIYFILGNNDPIKTNRQEDIYTDGQFHILNFALQTDAIPEQVNHLDRGTLLYPGKQIKYAGNYSITKNDSLIQACSYNYSRKESFLEHYSEDEILSEIDAAKLNFSVILPSKVQRSGLYHKQRNGKQYWRLFVLLCILFFSLEAIIQKNKL